MNQLGSLIVHLDNSTRSLTRLDVAKLIRRQLIGDTSVDISLARALYAPSPHYFVNPSAYGGFAENAIRSVYDAHNQKRGLAQTQLHAWNETNQSLIMWIDHDNELDLVGVVDQVLLSDLLVLGQFNPDSNDGADVPTDFVESLIIQSGKPAIVVPHTGHFKSIGDCVVIAWKPTREAGKALAASLMFLQRAKSIHILTDSEPTLAKDLRENFVTYLRSNMVEAEPYFHHAADVSAPDNGALSLAAQVQADLLVMGCYGHSRVRELILGGMTRTILSTMTLPVLMIA
jgi:nucleotide-binding universal stress UspA family protein